MFSMADVAPNQTIYVNNLPEKIGKEGERVRRWCPGKPLPVMKFWRSGCKQEEMSLAIAINCQQIAVCKLTSRIADLKKAVYAIFSQFGKILDVVALKTYRLRGQAWVVFADIRSAGEAIRTMQGFPFFDKPMVRAVMHIAKQCVC